MTWDISTEALAAWCADIVRRYPKVDVDLFVVRLVRIYAPRSDW